jgi:TonB family protein
MGCSPLWMQRTIPRARVTLPRWLFTVVALAGLASARTGLAQGTDPALTPPHVLTEAPAKYPEGATGAADVTLEIVVSENGGVTDVTVIEGTEPFAAAAVESARGYRFEPARRADKPVRARIRVVVSFTPPPPPRRSLPIPEEEPTTAPAKAAAPQPVQEVLVLGRKEPKTPTEHRMGRAEMRVVPGAFGDPFRALDVLPTLVPIVSGLPYFYIRGAPPSAVGYYVDEVRVPYLFHFALGPAVIQPALIEEVALHPAAFPGRYGRYAGGIVAGTTRDPAKELYGEAQIRIFDAGAYVEAPFAGGRGSAGVGGRYAYPGPILSLIVPEVTINYRDYNARASYDLSDRWRATVFTFGSFDYASEREDGVEDVLFASEFHRLDVRLDHRGADGSVSRVATTLGLDRTRLEDSRFAQSLLTGVRGRHQRRLGRFVDVEVGADALAEHYSGELPSPFSVSREDYEAAQTLFSPRTDTATGAWVSATYRPAEGWDLTATMRGDVFTSDGKVIVGPSPRTSMRVPLTSKIAFLGALGVAPQPPAFAIPIPAVGYRGLPGGLAFGYQKSAGFDVKLPLKFGLKAVGFHHTYFNMRDFAQDRGNLDFDDDTQLRTNAPTQSFGLEVFLSRKLSERFAAFMSLNVSRAQLGSNRFTKASVSPFDRTYVAQVGGVVDLGRNWRVSSRFLTYRGWPTDPPLALQTTNDRLPPFYRVDLRIEKRWIWREHRYIGLVLEGLNVTASKEILSRSCIPNGECVNEDFGPLTIPSIGVEGAL